MKTNDIYERRRSGRRLLEVLWDRECESPRTFDNVSTMLISWNGYSLGDEPDTDPDDYIDRLFLKTFSGPEALRELTGRLKREGSLVYDRTKRVWTLDLRRDGMAYAWEICPGGGLDDPRIVEEMLPLLSNRTKMELLEPHGYLFQVLSMYEHSGLALHKGVERGWDSGTCGFCVVTEERARREGATGDWREWAQRTIDAEVDEYDDWLQGQVFGYRVYEVPEDRYRAMLEEGEVTDDMIAGSGEVTCETWGLIGSAALKEATENILAA